MRKQKWKDAKEHFKNFENEFTWIDKINFGKVLLRRGEYSHVIKLCDQVLEEPSPGEKSSEYALILKAQSYLEEGKYQDVINIVNEFLTYDPYNNQMKRIKYTATNRLTLTPKEISQEVLKHIPKFKISYKPDFRQEIANSWPESIDDHCAQNDWGWKLKYSLEKMSEEIIKNLKKQYKVIA